VHFDPDCDAEADAMADEARKRSGGSVVIARELHAYPL
jgi:hypothetical protein